MIRNLLAMALCLCVPSLCSADVILQLGQGGTIGLTSFSATPGSTLSFDVYAVQSGLDPTTGNGDFRLSPGATARGLGSFFFDMAISNAANGTAQTGVQPTNPATTFGYKTGFDGRTGESGWVDRTGATANIQPTQTSFGRFVGLAPEDPNDTSLVQPRYATAPFQSTASPNTGPASANSILLGTINLDIKATAAGDYSLAFSAPGSIRRPTIGDDPLGGFFNMVYPGGALPAIVVNVSAVPEPTTIALFSICAGGLGFARFRRKAAKK